MRRPDVGQMLAELPAGTLDLWEVVDRHIGLEDRRDDMRATQMTSWILAANGVEIDPAKLQYDLDAQQRRREDAEAESRLSDEERIGRIRMAFGGQPKSQCKVDGSQLVRLADVS